MLILICRSNNFDVQNFSRNFGRGNSGEDRQPQTPTNQQADMLKSCTRHSLTILSVRMKIFLVSVSDHRNWPFEWQNLPFKLLIPVWNYGESRPYILWQKSAEFWHIFRHHWARSGNNQSFKPSRAFNNFYWNGEARKLPTPFLFRRS